MLKKKRKKNMITYCGHSYVCPRNTIEKKIRIRVSRAVGYGLKYVWGHFPPI